CAGSPTAAARKAAERLQPPSQDSVMGAQTAKLFESIRALIEAPVRAARTDPGAFEPRDVWLSRGSLARMSRFVGAHRAITSERNGRGGATADCGAGPADPGRHRLRRG